MQDRFMFYSNFLDAIEQLDDTMKGPACYEFCKYGITGELPNDPMLRMFCVGVSASVHKYQGSGGARAGAGRPKKENQNIQKNQNNQIIQNNQKFQIIQTETETQTETESKTETIIKENISKKGCRFIDSKYFDLNIPDSYLQEFEKMKENTNYSFLFAIDPFELYHSFSDYWVSVAGAKGVKLDWLATWRTWLRNTKPKSANSSGLTKREIDLKNYLARIDNWGKD